MGISRGATRALLGLRAAARPSLQQARNFRYETVISGPPRFKISSGEKIIHFTIIMCAFFATPAWVLTHIKEYRGLTCPVSPLAYSVDKYYIQIQYRDVSHFMVTNRIETYRIHLYDPAARTTLTEIVIL